MSPPMMLVMTLARYWNSARSEAPARVRKTDARCISPSLDDGVAEGAPPDEPDDEHQRRRPEKLQRECRPDRTGSRGADVDRHRHEGDRLEGQQLDDGAQQIRH